MKVKLNIERLYNRSMFKYYATELKDVSFSTEPVRYAGYFFKLLYCF